MYPDYSTEKFITHSLMQVNVLLQKYGALLFREMVSVELLAYWYPLFEAGFNAFDRSVYTGTLPQVLFENLYRYGHTHPNTITNFEQWPLEVLEQPMLSTILRQVMGPHFALMWKNAYPRRQGGDNPSHAIGWHKDTQFLGALHTVINTWIPFTPAGGSHPGLQLQLHNGSIWSPVMKPGDVLFFHCSTAHRTFLPQNSTIRLSSELRWIKAEEFSSADSPLYMVPAL